MQKIVPHLWYDTQAAEAARWYVSLFEDSRILHTTTMPGTPSGDVETVDFELAGMRFAAISAGPYFSLNPSISLMVACSTPEEIDRLYASLSEGGKELMPLGEYPFSKRYAWFEDKYGLSWQLMLVENQEISQKIRLCLLFSGEACGKAQEAFAHYHAVFQDARFGYANHYKPGEANDNRAKVNYSELALFGNQLVAMDHGDGGDFTFNEAFSLMVLCEDQQELDAYWEKLSAVPESEQCGWVKDMFGVSWQIVPRDMSDIMAMATKEEVERITQAFLNMKKIDIAALEKARLGV
ncbi:MAG TPA: VOC family protein [Clostridia bacterium]|nr:VOC family protein [Clostridia bacterium]